MSLTRTPYIVLLAILIAISTITVHAHSPELDLSVPTNSGTAVIDGTISTGEWDNAESKTFDMKLPGTTATQPATLFVMADDTNLYFALKYERASFDPVNTFKVSFDNAHDSGFDTGDDDIRSIGSNVFDDQYVAPSFIQRDDADGGTNDGSAARTLANGFITHEMSHPFNSDDDSHDISMQVGDTVGLQLFIQLSLTGPDLTVFPLGFPNFGDLTLLQGCNIETAADVDTIISSNCTLTSSITAGGSVRVESGAVMTISPTGTLNINFATKNLTVESGSGVLIKAGGTIT